MATNAGVIGALNAGELSPLLEGRVDKEFYSAGGKTVENFLPLVQGPLVQRSGTYFIKEVKDSTARTAIIPFEFNTTQAYALEFGNLYMRVYKDNGLVTLTSQAITAITKANPAVVTYSGSDTYANGDRVLITGVLGMVEVNNLEFTVANVNVGANTFELSGINSTSYGTYTSGGTVAEIYEIVTPYTTADLFETDGTLRLSVAQTADTMYIAHPSYPLRKLTRTGHTAWTLTQVSLVNGPYASANGDETARILCNATSGTYDVGDAVSVQSNTAIFDANMTGMLFYMEEIYFSDIDVSPWTVNQARSAIVGLQLSYNGNVYSQVRWQGTDGFGTGTVPPEHTVGDDWDGPKGAVQSNLWRYLHSRWAIVRLDTYTDTKNMSGTIVTYLSNGLAPAAKTITNVTNSAGLFKVTSTAHGYSEGDYVTITGVGGTTGANGDWKIVNILTNSFELEGSTFAGVYTSGGTAKRFSTWKWRLGAFSVSKGYPSIVSFYQERLVLASTSSQPDTIWLSCSGDYERFQVKFANLLTSDAAIDVTLASGQVNKILWATPTDLGLALGTSSREWLLGPAQTSTALAPDNVQAVPISDWGSKAIQPVRTGPGTTFFVQRSGRKVRDLGTTGDAEKGVGSDLIVRSEHLTKDYPIVDVAWQQEPDAILWCIRSDGALLAFTFQKEQGVFAWTRHILGGNSDAGDTLAPVVESICTIPASDGLSNQLVMIVNRYINGATRRYVEYLKPRYVTGTALAASYFVDAGLVYSGSPATTISGLTHLIGETVAILADGAVQPNQVVNASGQITLTSAASTVAIGLPMRARFQTMRLENPSAIGTSQGRRQIVAKAAIRLGAASQFRFGRSFTGMTTKALAATTDPLGSPPALRSGDVLVDWPGAWANEATLCFENVAPVPLLLHAIFPVTVSADA